ncbi:2,4-dihydroxyhept-2-ene-1,7-dioic acid aldolase [Aureimonas fodinaquatilis]|uniref:2,4-dihydroxyhept-2-ene-1,7-dioic acid aldolase n=1 Tax=Aureimonas fodinaquatilis TaxID=2565783 RepID=A0A5B0DTA1_9HYPH|nr:aldolase/citrate lyase family protein [Aureimonas fodinaquatilis]KAA0969643.1 2,4-dihydroxyhept-2-ene-1,7-dioic acid aldolase [Aureimonas fodinaquatilis]
MQGAKLRQKLIAGEAIGMINPHQTSATLAGRLTELGADAIFVDCEHGAWGYEDVRVTGQIVRGAQGAIIVRPDSHQRSSIIRYLNVGADGLMVPMVNTAAEAREIVDTVRYACPRDYDDRLIVCMIESADTVKNELDSMLEVDGVDVFFLGPNDLAQSMGYPSFTPYGSEPPADVDEMVELALAKITAAGKIGGTLTRLERVDHWLEKGARLIYYHSDPILRDGIAAFQNKLG